MELEKGPRSRCVLGKKRRFDHENIGVRHGWGRNPHSWREPCQPSEVAQKYTGVCSAPPAGPTFMGLSAALLGKTNPEARSRTVRNSKSGSQSARRRMAEQRNDTIASTPARRSPRRRDIWRNFTVRVTKPGHEARGQCFPGVSNTRMWAPVKARWKTEQTWHTEDADGLIRRGKARRVATDPISHRAREA